jgi:hypothetical protein
MQKESTTPAWLMMMTFLRKVMIMVKYLPFRSEGKYWVEEEQTVEKLQVPTADQRSKYHFCNPIIKTMILLHTATLMKTDYHSITIKCHSINFI